MANLVELSNDLEFVPKEQLIQMSQDPNSQYPSYLVLSEIQRRTQMEKMYDAQQPKPQTSVAEEVVAEFANSPSGLGAMAQSLDLQQAFPSGDMSNMAPPSPMQMMASGGRTGYQAGTYGGYNLDAYSSTPNKVEEQIQSTLNNPMLDNLTEEEIEALLNLRKAKSTLGDKAFEFMFGEEFGDEFMDYASLIPAGGISMKAAQKGLPMIPKGYKAIKDYFRGPKKNPSGKVTSAEAYGGEGYKYIKPIVENPVTSSIVATPILGGINKLTGEPDPLEAQTQTESSQEQVLQDVITGDGNADKGLGQRFKDFATSPNNADMLIGLGGAIGSARNLGELSSGISDAYRGVISDRAAVKQAGLQGRLLEAQISKIELEVANMPLDIAIKQYQSLNDLVDSGVLTAEEAKIREVALDRRIQELQGITVAEKAQRNKNLGLESLITELG